MSLLEKLENAIKSDLMEIQVEAWDETFYVYPINAKEMITLQKKFPDFLTNSSLEAGVELIMMKALKKDGEKAFTLEHKPLLLRQHFSVILQFYAALIGTVLQEDHEKN